MGDTRKYLKSEAGPISFHPLIIKFFHTFPGFPDVTFIILYMYSYNIEKKNWR